MIAHAPRMLNSGAARIREGMLVSLLFRRAGAILTRSCGPKVGTDESNWQKLGHSAIADVGEKSCAVCGLALLRSHLVRCSPLCTVPLPSVSSKAIPFPPEVDLRVSSTQTITRSEPSTGMGI